MLTSLRRLYRDVYHREQLSGKSVQSPKLLKTHPCQRFRLARGPSHPSCRRGFSAGAYAKPSRIFSKSPVVWQGTPTSIRRRAHDMLSSLQRFHDPAEALIMLQDQKPPGPALAGVLAKATLVGTFVASGTSLTLGLPGHEYTSADSHY